MGAASATERRRWAGRTFALGVFTLSLVQPGEGAEGPAGFQAFRPFSIIYEPSGVQQLPDGRFVVVEDEATHSLGIFTLKPDGQVVEKALYRASQASRVSSRKIMRRLEDLEGVAVDGRGNVFVITSHSRKENGKRKAVREQLVRFRVEGDRVADVGHVGNLRKRITKKHPFLKRAAKERDVK